MADMTDTDTDTVSDTGSRITRSSSSASCSTAPGEVGDHAGHPEEMSNEELAARLQELGGLIQDEAARAEHCKLVTLLYNRPPARELELALELRRQRQIDEQIARGADGDGDESPSTANKPHAPAMGEDEAALVCEEAELRLKEAELRLSAVTSREEEVAERERLVDGREMRMRAREADFEAERAQLREHIVELERLQATTPVPRSTSQMAQSPDAATVSPRADGDGAEARREERARKAREAADIARRVREEDEKRRQTKEEEQRKAAQALSMPRNPNNNRPAQTKGVGTEADVTDSAIQEAYESMRSAKLDSINWMLLGYGDSRTVLKLYASGKDGLSGLTAAVRPDEGQFAYLRLTYGGEAASARVSRNKFVFFVIIPDTISGMKKAKANLHTASVEAFFKVFHIAHTVLSLADMAEDVIMRKIQMASVAD